MNWLTLSLIALVCWGLWGLILKLASNYMGWHQMFILTNVVYLSAALLFYGYFRPSFMIHPLGWLFVVLAGLAGTIGTAAFYIALSGWKVSVVVPLTALYPAVTILLSLLFLREEVALHQIIGVVLAVAAIFLISIR